MKRRTLLQLSGLCGAGIAAPFYSQFSRAQSEDDFEGPFWICITASGGWDPRFLFDPTLVPEQNRLYTELGQVGNIPFAPIDAEPGEFGLETPEYLNPERFLNRFGNRITVFNGVDTSTNNHDAGQRAVTCGSIQQGIPAIGALLAASHTPDKPLPFVSFGGYDATLDVAPLSRIGNSNLLRDLASPNSINPEREQSDTYHTPETWTRIRQAQAQRLSEMSKAQRLPRLHRAQEALLAARRTDSELKALQLPELIDLPGNLGGGEQLLRSGQLALAGFKAGLGVAANLRIGGFDTHGNHDQNQRLNLIRMLTGVGALLDEIDAQGLREKVYVVVGSDFGRTPHYNADGNGGGKDHWPVTSYFVSGPGIEGDRVVGATNDDQIALKVDPTTLAVADSGSKLSPAQIHLSLRELGGIKDELIKRFPLAGTRLPLFS